MDFTKLFDSLSNTAQNGLTGTEFTNNSLINMQISRSASIYDNLGGIGANTTTNPGRVNERQITGEQTAASTTNKVPRIYGEVTTGGIITDAVYTNTGNTLSVCVVLSEYNANYDFQNTTWTTFDNGYYEPTGTESSSWSIDSVYRNDQKLIFGDGTASFKFHDAHYLETLDDQTQVDINTKLSMWVYAGSGNSADQIFPAAESSGGGSLGNAWDFMPGWTSSNTMTDLVFAIIQIDYDAALELEEFGSYAFTVKNNIANYYDDRLSVMHPATALEDYLTNTRYGLGLDPATVDSGAWDQRWVTPNLGNNTDDSFRDWLLFSKGNLLYLPDGTTNPDTQGVEEDRHVLAAVISTADGADTNINTLCQAGNAYLRFDHKQLKWTVIYNHDFTDAEIDAAFNLNSDNILSAVNIQSTDLFSMYNSVEAKFPNNLIRDTVDVVVVETPAGLKQPNEPFNQLSLNYVGVNTRHRAATQAEIDLKQSRSAQTLSMTADYSAMQLDVGDLVTVTLPEYGFDNSYYRVLRTTETETVDGMIQVNLVLRYTDRLIYREGWFEDTFNDIDGVNYRPDADNKDATFTLVEFVDADYVADTANYYNSAGSLINTTDWGTADAIYNNETASPRDFVGFKWSSLTNTNSYNEFDITAINGNHRVGVPVGYVSTITPDGFGTTGAIAMDKDRLIDNGAYTFDIKFRDTDEYLYESQTITVPSRSYADSGVTGSALTDTFGPNTVASEVLGDIVETSTGTYNVLFEKTHDIVEMPKGVGRIELFTQVAGINDYLSTSDIKFHPSAEVLFVSKTGGKTSFPVSFTYNIEFENVGNFDTAEVFRPFFIFGEFSTDPDHYNLDDSWYPTRITVRANGYNTIPTTGAFETTSYSVYNRDAYDRSIQPGWYPE